MRLRTGFQSSIGDKLAVDLSRKASTITDWRANDSNRWNNNRWLIYPTFRRPASVILATPHIVLTHCLTRERLKPQKRARPGNGRQIWWQQTTCTWSDELLSIISLVALAASKNMPLYAHERFHYRIPRNVGSVWVQLTYLKRIATHIYGVSLLSWSFFIFSI